MSDRGTEQDARFEDSSGLPLRLSAEAQDDLGVISALIQDSIAVRNDMAWLARRHRFNVLLNRFRWEDRAGAERQNRPFERVRSLLTVESVLRVRSDGIDPEDQDAILSLLSISFSPKEDGAGYLKLIFAGDGEIALDVECIDVRLTDVTRPYYAQVRNAPRHPED